MPAEWPLTGRAEELRLVRGLERRSAGVVLAGAAGVGKTRLAREVLAGAARRGALTRWAVATASARALPLGAFAALLGPVDADPARLLREAGEALAGGGGPVGVVLGVDDGHLLDELSATLVHQLALRRAATLVVTVRTGEPAPDAVTALWKDGHLQRLEVQPLSADEIAQLVEAVLGGPVERTTARRLWTITAGNVLYLRQLVDSEREAGRLAAEGGVWRWHGQPQLSPGLAELVQARIGALSDAERDVVELLAFGEPLGAPLLEQLADADAVERVEARGLVQVSRDGRRLEARLAHPLYGEVQRARCGQLRARRLRGRIATAIARTGARRVDDVLRQAMLALDSDLASEPALLIEAAGVAARLTDLPTAVRLARAAVAAGRGFPARLSLASALVAIGQPAVAELADLAAHATTGPERVTAAGLRATSLLFGPRWAEASRVLDEAEATVEGTELFELTALRALCEAIHGHPNAAVVAATAALDSPTLSPEATGFACWGLIGAFALLGRGDELDAPAARAATALAAAPGHTWMNLPLLGYRLFGRELTGEVAEVQRLAAEARSRYGDSPYGADVVTYLLGSAALSAGSITAAVRLLRDARVGLAAFGFTGWLYACLTELPRALALQGDIEAARQALAELDAHDVCPVYTVRVRLAHVWTAAAEGAVSEAVALAHEAAALARALDHRAPEVVALHDAVRLGDRTVTTRLTDLAAEVDGPLAPAAADHAAALAADDADGLLAASARFENMGALLRAADAAAQAAAVHERHGRRGSAYGAAVRARRLADACAGAQTPALRALAQPLPLTDREREIVMLVAAGLSNRQIAERLVVSVRTVEGHVYRACAKLGVNDRTALRDLVSG